MPSQLRTYAERIGRLDEEIKALTDDRRDVYAEAKSNGFDVKQMREAIRRWKRDPEEEAVVETYLADLGDYGTTALGKAAIRRERAEARAE